MQPLNDTQPPGDGLSRNDGFTVTYEGQVVASGGIFDTPMLSFPFGDNSTCPEINFELSILTDFFPSETTWELYDNCTNELILSGGPYDTVATQFTEPASLPPSEYSLFINDAAGTYAKKEEKRDATSFFIIILF